MNQEHIDARSALLWFLRRDLKGYFRYIAVGENRDRGISDIYFNGDRLFRIMTTEAGVRTVAWIN